MLLKIEKYLWFMDMMFIDYECYGNDMEPLVDLIPKVGVAAYDIDTRE